MKKTINLKLNKFPSTPNVLLDPTRPGMALTNISINLASLYHHYYLDTHGKAPPNPDPANFEYVEFLASCGDFRYVCRGLGTSATSKRNKSYEMGQAFCRLFLHDYIGITYFAHMSDVLNKGPVSRFSIKVEKTADGDAPDYLCASDVANVYLAESKGRYKSVSFTNKEFDSWRDQFKRVVVKNASGQAKSVKGYIVATRFATEDKPGIDSCLFAEDPKSPGNTELTRDEGPVLGAIVISQHYASIFQKMNMHIISASLANIISLPSEFEFQIPVWELMGSPYKKSKFVGGLYSTTGELRLMRLNDGSITVSTNPLRLDLPVGTFFGLDLEIFTHVVNSVRNGRDGIGQIQVREEVQDFYNAVSVLRDGSIIAPAEMMRFIDFINV